MDFLLFSLLSALGFRRFAYRKIYLHSEHWKNYRKKKLIAAHNTCQSCHRSFWKDQLNVHHLTYERLWHEKMGDTEVLCIACHRLAHSE